MLYVDCPVFAIYKLSYFTGGVGSVLYQKISPSGRADFTASALLQHACGSSLQRRMLRLASAANSAREISGLGIKMHT